MNKPELFQAIETLYPYLREYQQKGTTKIPLHHQQLLKRVWEENIMRTTLNTGCSSCLVYAMNVAQSYYEREFPIWQAQNAPQPTPEEPKAEPPQPEAESIIIDSKKPCKGCKKGKDNSK